MASIDLDRHPPLRRTGAERRGSVAVVLALAALILAAAPASTPAPAAATTLTLVTVTASPAEHAVVGIWLADGTQLRPELGQPVEVAELAGVQVFVPGEHDALGASCSIAIDGHQVVSYIAIGAGSVASCTWPE